MALQDIPVVFLVFYLEIDCIRFSMSLLALLFHYFFMHF